MANFLVLPTQYSKASWSVHNVSSFFGHDVIVRELYPMLDRHKSFYNRAHIVELRDKRALYSYNTKVAEYDIQTRKMVVYGTYSATTIRHIKEFLYQQGFGINKKSDIEKFNVA